MNNELIIYGHAGACNHGNEAIIRGLHTLLPNKKIKVFSLDPESDWLWDLPSIVEVDELRKKLPRYSPKNIIGHLLYRITKNDRYRWKFEFKNFIKQVKNKVCIFEMGDQFCEPDPYVIKMYSYLNREIHMGGGKTIGLGCSINESVFNNKYAAADLRRYDLVIPRETLTQRLLNENHVDSVMIPDVAFCMKASNPNVDGCILNKTQSLTIGIVVGNIAQGNENKSKQLEEGIKEFIDYIIQNTDYRVVLLPHVNAGKYLNDLDMENNLYKQFSNTSRVYKVPEYRADKIKWFISKCDYLVSLRMHAAIAAISCNIPTLLIGYSIKYEGLTKDIIEIHNNELVDINTQNIGFGIIDRFNALQEKANSGIKNDEGIQEYMSNIESLKRIIEEMENE